jgi:SpoVK/Ycf46/Vps4 family AAA+-type ATPase
LAIQTTGYVGADLAALCRETINTAVLRKSQAKDALTENNKKLELSKSDFAHALTKVTPSLLRSTQVDVAMTTWDSIGGLEEAKKVLTTTITNDTCKLNEACIYLATTTSSRMANALS